MAVLGTLTHLVGWGMTTVAAGTFLVATLVGNVLPWVGISTSRLSTHPPKSDLEIFSDAPEVERDAGAAPGRGRPRAHGGPRGRERRRHGPLHPQLVSAGVSGALLVFVGFVATLLRTRHSRTRTTVLIAMVSGSPASPSPP